MNEIMTALEDKRFSDFAQKAKISLEDKLRNNPIMISKAKELKKYTDMKSIFSQIKRGN